MIDTLQDVPHYQWYGGSILDSIKGIKEKGIILINECIWKPEWEAFERHLDSISKTVVVITDGLPREWIQNKKINVVVRQGHVQHTLRSWKNNILKGKLKHFKRQAENLPYDFFLMYGRYCNMKEPIFHELLKKQILQNSIYSCPAIENERLATSIEDISKAPPDSMRFAHDKNAHTVITNCQKTKCHLVLETNGLKENDCAFITEKSLWPLVSQMPAIWITTARKYQQLTDWGLQPAEPSRFNIRAIVEQLLYLQKVFQDPLLSQKWQDDQGEKINKNVSILNSLCDRLQEEEHLQYKNLGLVR